MYRSFSKVIVNRLKICIDKFVSHNQIGVIPGRSIHENIVVSHEMLHTMNHIKVLIQGEHIFPYLFVLCMDKLSHIINEEVIKRIGTI